MYLVFVGLFVVGMLAVAALVLIKYLVWDNPNPNPNPTPSSPTPSSPTRDDTLLRDTFAESGDAIVELTGHLPDQGGEPWRVNGISPSLSLQQGQGYVLSTLSGTGALPSSLVTLSTAYQLAHVQLEARVDVVFARSTSTTDILGFVIGWIYQVGEQNLDTVLLFVQYHTETQTYSLRLLTGHNVEGTTEAFDSGLQMSTVAPDFGQRWPVFLSLSPQGVVTATVGALSFSGQGTVNPAVTTHAMNTWVMSSQRLPEGGNATDALQLHELHVTAVQV